MTAVLGFGSRNDGFGNDMPDTLVNEGSFFRIGRESGVMLDTLIGEDSFQTVDTEDMSDTLAEALKARSDFEIRHSEVQFDKPILKQYIKVFTVAI